MRRHHGGIQHKMGKGIIDFSTTYNFYGPPREVLDAITAADVTSYPDPEAYRARKALSRHMGYPVAHFAIGHGASDLFWALAKTLVVPSSGVVLVEPCFSEFKAALESSSARTYSYRLQPPDFTLCWENIEKIITKTRSKILAIETPHNPSGLYTPVEDILTWAETHPHITVVFDLSFLALSHHAGAFPTSLPENLILVCSLTKTFALAGLRVGYMIAHPHVIESLNKHRQAWSTSIFVQEAIIAMMKLKKDMETQRVSLLSQMDTFLQHLKMRPIRIFPSCTLFVLMYHEDGPLLVKKLLEKYHLLVRCCASFGLENYIRLSLRSPDMNAHLFHALDAERKTS